MASQSDGFEMYERLGTLVREGLGGLKRLGGADVYNRLLLRQCIGVTIE